MCDVGDVVTLVIVTMLLTMVTSGNNDKYNLIIWRCEQCLTTKNKERLFPNLLNVSRRLLHFFQITVNFLRQRELVAFSVNENNFIDYKYLSLLS